MTKDEVFEDVKIGNYIKIRTDAEVFEGRVESIGETSLKIKRDDTGNSKRVNYDILKDYEVLNELQIQNSEKLSREELTLVESDISVKENPINSDLLGLIDKILSNFFECDSDENVELRFDSVYKSINQQLSDDEKKETSKIKSKLIEAKKNHEDYFENARIKQIFSLLDELISNGNRKIDILRGVLLLDYKQVESINSFLVGGEYKYAFYAAKELNCPDEKIKAALLAISEKQDNREIFSFALRYAKEINDISYLQFILTNNDQYKNESLLHWYRDNECITNSKELNIENILSMLNEKFNSEPQFENHEIQQWLSEYKTKDKEKDEKHSVGLITGRTGIISSFNQEKLYGFIGDVFFHIKQVSDTKLQSLLFSTSYIKNKKIHVSYRLGRTRDGKIAADDVRLVEKILDPQKTNINLEGKILDYEIFSYFGTIDTLGKSLRFNFNEVKDILLSVLLDEGNLKFPINILYDEGYVKDKKIAINIRLNQDISKEKIDSLLKRRKITSEQLKTRNLQLLNDDEKERSYYIDYVPLFPIDGDMGGNTTENIIADNFYFEMARQADMYEKDLNKAILNYKKAINLNQNLTGSVLNLALIYSRLELKQDALQLLEEYRSEIDDSRYLNTKVQILQKNIEDKYASELIDCENKLIHITTSKDKILLHKLNIARVYFQIEDYCNAEKVFLELFNIKYLDNQKKKQILISLCNIKLKTKELGKAVEYAKMILDEFPEDAYALSIVNNTIEEDDIDAYNDSDFNTGTEISSYIIRRIEQLSLITELKKQDSKKINEENIFQGSEKDAETLMISLTKQETGNDGVKSNQRFARAKIIKQIMDRDSFNGDSKYINDKEYRSNIAYGTLYYGNHRLYNISFDLTKNLDTARYLYLESAKILKDSEKMHPCCYLAILSFFKTFFTEDETEIKRIPAVRDSGQNINDDFKISLSEIFRGTLKVSSKVFIAGLLECIEYDDRNRKLILETLERSHLKDMVCEELLNLNKSSTIESFAGLISDALKKYIGMRAQFIRNISNLVKNTFSLGVLSDSLEKIRDTQFLDYLNNTDKQHWNKLYSIFGKLRKYNEVYDFEYKSGMIADAYEDTSLLEEQITKNPTRFGYDLLLKRLEVDDLQAKIYKESQVLFESSEPEIDIQLDVDSITVNADQNFVSFGVNFVNKENVQNADNVKIIASSFKAKNLSNDELGKTLIKGGKLFQKLFKFELTPSVIEEKVLPIQISVSYQYSKNMSEILEFTTEKELSVILVREKFELIDNKFAKYRDGSPVKDEEMFFGRENDIERIINQVCDSNGNIHSGKSLALYGQTRTGKSSLLYHVEKKLRERLPGRNIIINIGSIGELDLFSGLYEFLFAVLDQLKTELSHNHKDFYDKLIENNIVIDPDLLEESKVQQQFNKMFKDLVRFIEETNSKHNIILMIDEFTYIYDWIKQGAMTDRFMKFWKGFIQNNDIYAIIIGQDHMMQFVNDNRFTNDFGSTEQQKVTYLSEKAAKDLMVTPILMKTSSGLESRYKDGALEKIYELTSGSAFLIMKLCAGIVDYINEVIQNPYITVAYIDEYLKKYLPSFEESKYFEPQYLDKSSLNDDTIVEKNKEMLKRIAQFSPRREWTPLDKVIHNSDDEQILKNLEERDVVVIDEGQRCKIKVALYKEWILAKYGERI